MYTHGSFMVVHVAVHVAVRTCCSTYMLQYVNVAVCKCCSDLAIHTHKTVINI